MHFQAVVRIALLWRGSWSCFSFHFDANLDPDPVPDPTFHSHVDADPDPDPTFQFDADPDPNPNSNFSQIWTLRCSKMTLFHLFPLMRIRTDPDPNPQNCVQHTICYVMMYWKNKYLILFYFIWQTTSRQRQFSLYTDNGSTTM